MYQYKEYEHLSITKKGSIAKLMLNRPKKDEKKEEVAK